MLQACPGVTDSDPTGTASFPSLGLLVLVRPVLAAGYRADLGAVIEAWPLTGAARRPVSAPVLHDASVRLTIAAATRRNRLLMRLGCCVTMKGP